MHQQANNARKMFLENFSFRFVFSKTPKENWYPDTDSNSVSSAYTVTFAFQHTGIV